VVTFAATWKFAREREGLEALVHPLLVATASWSQRPSCCLENSTPNLTGPGQLCLPNPGNEKI